MDFRLLALQAAAPAADAQAQQPGLFWVQVFPLVLIFGVFWFMVIRPQKKKEQTRQDMLTKLKKNDRVCTSGGIYGTIVGVKDNEVILRVDDDTNTRIRVMRQSILGPEGKTDDGDLAAAASEEKQKS